MKIKVIEIGFLTMSHSISAAVKANEVNLGEIINKVKLHKHCNWGHCQDSQLNDQIVAKGFPHGDRLFGVHQLSTGHTIWIITEHSDGSIEADYMTTILFPADY